MGGVHWTSRFAEGFIWIPLNSSPGMLTNLVSGVSCSGFGVWADADRHMAAQRSRTKNLLNFISV